MLRHDVGYGLAARLLLQVAGDPGALGAGEYLVRHRFIGGERTVVEVRSVVEVVRLTPGVEFHVQHAPGNDTALAAGQGASVANGVFQGEQHPGL